MYVIEHYLYLNRTLLFFELAFTGFSTLFNNWHSIRIFIGMKVNKSGTSELIVWLLALIGLYALGGASAQTISLCPLDNLGFTWCPGCGIGRSMHYFMHGDLRTSWTYHPLGWFAVGVILFRIIELFKLKIKKKLWQMY